MTSRAMACVSFWALLFFLVEFPVDIAGGTTGYDSSICFAEETPVNGNMTQTWDWFGHKMALYSCDPGYVAVGQGAVTSCDEPPCRTWAGQAPRCAVADCLAHYNAGRHHDGIYGVMLDGKTTRLVHCDMTGGGWTVFQRRLDASIYFYRDWADYKAGFGEHEGNMWLGLDALHALTRAQSELHVFLETGTGESAYAMYNGFRVGGKQENYTLTVTGYHGTAGDSLARHSGRAFSTRDRDNDRQASVNCAQDRKGGWWYDTCTDSNLNGLYVNGTFNGKGMKYSAIYWKDYKGSGYSYKTVVMKVRRKTA